MVIVMTAPATLGALSTKRVIAGNRYPTETVLENAAREKSCKKP